MFVEVWVIAAVAIVAIYLLYRSEKLSALIKDLTVVSESFDKSQLALNRQLFEVVLYEDSRVFSKLQKKQREKIILEQANDIRLAFENSYKGTHYVNGRIVNDRPMEFYLSNALGSQVEYFEKDPATTNFSIAEAMRARIEELTRK